MKLVPVRRGGRCSYVIDLDGLAYTFPRGTDDPYGDAIALENLAAIWPNSRKRGVEHLIVARVIESRNYANQIASSVDIDAPIVCRLTGTDDTLLARVRKREIGVGLAWHEKRSLQLARELEVSAVEDYCVATDDQTVTQVAKRVLAHADWLRDIAP